MRTVRIHLSVDGQVAQSWFLNPLSHPILSLGHSPLVSNAPCQPSCKSSSNTVSAAHILNACIPTLGTPSFAHAPIHKPHSQWPNWTMTVIMGRKPGCPEIGSGGKRLLRSPMPHLVLSFPSLLREKVSKHLWLNSMPTPAPPHPALCLQFEVAHALGWPTMAAHVMSLDTQLTLDLRPQFSIRLHISYLTAPLSRFFVITYLRTSHFITYFGQ